MKKKPAPPTDRKTRAQRAQLVQDGVPPSPPQTYTPPKKTRKVAPSRSKEPHQDPEASSSERPHTLDEGQQAQNTPEAIIEEPKPKRSKGKKPILHSDASTQTPVMVPEESPKVLYVPRGNQIPFSTIHIEVDSYLPPGSTSIPGDLRFALPTALLSPILSYVASHPSSEGTELGRLALEQKVAKDIVAAKNTISVTKRVADPYVNGKLRLGHTKAVTIEIPNPYADDEIPDSNKQPLKGLSSDPPTQVQQGQNSGLFSQNQGDQFQVLESSTENRGNQQQVPETPRPRWNLSGLLPTAHSVAKFIPIPFSSRRTAPATDAAQPSVAPSQEELDFSRPNPHPISFAARSHSQASVGVEDPEVNLTNDVGINPRQTMHVDMESHGTSEMHGDMTMRDSTDTPDNIAIEDAPALATAATDPSKRKNLTKGQAEAKRRSEGRKKGLKAQTEVLMAERARLREEMEAFQKEKAEFEAQVAGGKRKRLSPQEPPRSGFHLTYDYSSSDSEGEEGNGQQASEAQETSTKSPHPAKRARIDGAIDEAIFKDLHSAQPYHGDTFALPKTPATSLDDNIFTEESSTENPDAQPEHYGENTRVNTAKRQPNTFKVPSPSDSDWEDTELFDDNETIPTAQSPSAPSSQSIFQTSPLASKQSQTRLAAGPSAEPSKSMIPPPRPNPSHASLPSILPVTGRPAFAVDPVEKARQKALKHQPVTGSRLRESSRLSTSTVGSEAEEEPSVVIENDEYDPKHPAILTSALPNASPEDLPWPGYVNALDEWKMSVSSRVGNLVMNTWSTVKDDKAVQDQFEQDMADFDNIDDGIIILSSGNNSVEVAEPVFDAEENELGISPRVQDIIDRNWRPEDAQAAKDQFDAGFASYCDANLGMVA
ncbi:hypothetical protein P7C71_g2068, partial [Lecanoromycetidae sp. Uapishka_2]